MTERTYEVGDLVYIRIKISRRCYWQPAIIDRPKTNGMYRVELSVELGGRKVTHGWYETKDIKRR